MLVTYKTLKMNGELNDDNSKTYILQSVNEFTSSRQQFIEGSSYRISAATGMCVHSIFTYGVNKSSGASTLWQSPLKNISESLDKFEVNYGVNHTI